MADDDNDSYIMLCACLLKHLSILFYATTLVVPLTLSLAVCGCAVVHQKGTKHILICPNGAC